MKIISAMYDYARGNCVLPKTLEDIISSCEKFGLNALTLHFEDIAIFLKPKIHRGTLNPERLKNLNYFAYERGITIIPVIALFGHAEQSLSHKEYSSLAEFEKSHIFNIYNPKTYDVLFEVLQKVASIFSGPYIHIGCDEVWELGLGKCPGISWPVMDYVKHLNRLAEMVLSLDRRPMFWGDMISRFYQEYVVYLNQQLIPVDWFYEIEDQYPTIRWWNTQGFQDVIVAPTVGYHGDIFPSLQHPSINIRKLIDEGIHSNAMGVIMTSWEHLGATRYSERQQMNFLGACLAREGIQRSDREILMEYWQRLGFKSPGKIIEFYECCDNFVSLLPEGLNDLCDNPLQRRTVWFEKYDNAKQKMIKLKKMQKRIATLAFEIIPPKNYIKKHQPFKLAALRTEHVMAMLRLNQKDISGMKSRILRLKHFTRQEWETERFLENEYYQKIDYVFDEQLKKLSNLYESTDFKQTINPAIPVTHSVFGKTFLTNCSIDGLHVRGTDEYEKENTKIWFLCGDDSFYVKFRCMQTGPVRALESKTDLILTRDDIVCLQIDYHHEHKKSLWIGCNPAGIARSEVHSINGKSVFNSIVSIDIETSPKRCRHFWEVVIRISFPSFGIPKPNESTIWGLALERRNRNTGQISYWGGDPMFSRSNPCALGHLEFIN